MIEYKSLIQEVLQLGNRKNDRTKTGTISRFGCLRRYDLRTNFPLLTTKRIHWKSVVHELLWFIKGETNIKYLVDNNVKIWNEWPFNEFKKSIHYKNETMKEFIDRIKKDEEFAKKHGELGPIYGSQWRNYNNEGFDQLQQVVSQLINQPTSRRIILTAWNPLKTKEMLLPPCHVFVQFYVNNGELSCHLYQRSADVFLGVPFNIASYSLLTLMLAQVCKLKPHEFIHTTGDTHIYLNHLEQVYLQLKRDVKPLPKVVLNKKIKSIFDFKYEDILLRNYNPHPSIKGKVAV